MLESEIALIQARHETDKVLGRSHKIAKEALDLLYTAQSALSRGKSEVVSERIAAATELLRQLLNK